MSLIVVLCLMPVPLCRLREIFNSQFNELLLKQFFFSFAFCLHSNHHHSSTDAMFDDEEDDEEDEDEDGFLPGYDM